MNRARVLVFGLFLVGSMAAAVSTLVAQTAGTQERTERPRMLMLDGRGAQLGVSVSDLKGDELKGAASGGVRVDDVDEDSPAAKAGIREGDIVVEFDGERVRSSRQFARLVQESPDGRPVKLGLLREGKRQTLDVTPESRAFGWGVDGDRLGRDIARSMRELEPRLREFRFDAPGFNFEFPGMMTPRGRLGIQIDELNPQLAQYFGAKDGGILVSSVNENSAAQKAGLKAGDVITSINGATVRNYDDLREKLRDVSGEVTIGIIRDKKESTLKATVEDARARMRRPGRPI